MKAEFTQVPAEMLKNIQLNAGCLLSEFDPSAATLVRENIIGATTGDISISIVQEVSDFFEDVNNMPGKTKQGAFVDTTTGTLSGTFISADSAVFELLMTACDKKNESGVEHYTFRNGFLKDADFKDVWWVGDYSIADGETAGCIAIKFSDALNTGNFSFTATNKGKGQFAFELEPYYDLADTDVVPIDVYIKAAA